MCRQSVSALHGSSVPAYMVGCMLVASLAARMNYALCKHSAGGIVVADHDGRSLNTIHRPTLVFPGLHHAALFPCSALAPLPGLVGVNDGVVVSNYASKNAALNSCCFCPSLPPLLLPAAPPWQPRRMLWRRERGRRRSGVRGWRKSRHLERRWSRRGGHPSPSSPSPWNRWW